MPSPSRISAALALPYIAASFSMSATARPVISAVLRRRELRQDLALDLVEAQRVPGDVVAVGELVAHQDVHDAERQRGIGADADRQVEVGCLGAARAARIDHHDRHAALLALLLGQRPEMHVGGGEVGAPGDHQVGMHDRLRDRRRRPGRPSCPRRPRSRCRRPCRPAGARCRARGTGRSPGRGSSGPDGRSRRSPGCASGPLSAMIAFHLAAISSSASSQVIGLNWPEPLGPVRLQRRRDALGRVHQVGVAVDLAAGEARRVGMIGVALDAHDLAVLDMGDERAHVGAIVRTNDSNRLHHTVSPKGITARSVAEALEKLGLTSSWPRP